MREANCCGFDEFFGNLYHLNAEDEPEHPDYPKNPAFRAARVVSGLILRLIKYRPEILPEGGSLGMNSSMSAITYPNIQASRWCDIFLRLGRSGRGGS